MGTRKAQGQGAQAQDGPDAAGTSADGEAGVDGVVREEASVATPEEPVSVGVARAEAGPQDSTGTTGAGSEPDAARRASAGGRQGTGADAAVGARKGSIARA